MGLCCALAVQVCIAETKNEYWPNGNLKAVQEYREDGSLEKETEYDQNGEKVVEAYYSSNGSLRTGMDGWAAMRWKYKDGSIMAGGYYGSNGRLTEYKEYNSQGDLVNKEYFGSDDLNAAEEYNSVPTIEGETISYYDKDGVSEGSAYVRTGTLLFPEEWVR